MMTTPIAPVSLPDPAAALRPHAAPGAGFQSVLSSALNTVDAIQHNAAASVSQFLAGQGGELHQVALAQQQAQLSFELFLQMRNKAVQAYQEIMRMQL